MKCPQGLWVQTLITAVFQPTYMLTSSTNMNASIFWKEIVQFSQRMILISWLFLHNIFTTYLYFSCVFLKHLPEKESLISTCNVVNSRYHLFIARFLENIHPIDI